MTLGEYIKDRRTELNMSRNMLAQKAGISHTEIHRIEVGDRKQPSLKVLCALADGLSRNSDLADEDLDDLYKQVEMFIEYAKRKNDSE